MCRRCASIAGASRLTPAVSTDDALPYRMGQRARPSIVLIIDAVLVPDDQIERPGPVDRVVRVEIDGEGDAHRADGCPERRLPVRNSSSLRMPEHLRRRLPAGGAGRWRGSVHQKSADLVIPPAYGHRQYSFGGWRAPLEINGNSCECESAMNMNYGACGQRRRCDTSMRKNPETGCGFNANDSNRT